MRQLLSTVMLGACACGGGTAAAAGGAATDQAVTLTYSSAHWSGTPGASLTGVDATGNQLYQTGLWYRAEGDTREYPMPAPDTETYADGQVEAVWSNLDGKGFAVGERTTVFDGEGPSGGLVSLVFVTNNNTSPRQLTLFHYLDADLAATTSGDSGTLLTPRYIEVSDGASHLAFRATSSSHYQVAAFSSLRDLLNDSLVTNLSDGGLPFGPGDFSAAFQLETGPLPAGGGTFLGPVSVYFNPARRHVKGDYFGARLASLYGQAPDLSGRFVTWMRRDRQLSSYVLGAPSGANGLVGVDDFDGDFVDELLYRDRVSGVVHLGSATLAGAPTLALNWKLSATGDFSSDGRADILWRNTTSQKLVIWTMNGSTKTGNIIPSPDQAVDANWEVAAAADFNGDLNRDLLWYNQTTGKIVLWFMDYSVVRIAGQFTNPASVGNNNWRVLAVGDYGKGLGGWHDTQDIVWQNDTSKKVVIWFMDVAGSRTSGTFTTPDALNLGWDLVGPR